MFNVISDKIKNKRVLLRVDFNVPIVDGVVTDYTRVDACVDSVNLLLKNNNKVFIISHLGRPVGVDDKLTLKIILPYLEKLFNQQIQFVENYIDGFTSETNLALLENVRFYKGEEDNDENLSEKLANLADVLVVDSFATAHRKASSTYGAILRSKEVYAGLLFEKEVSALSKALKSPERPVLAVVGGSKISTKLPIIENLLNVVDYMIVGGGIANTFLFSQGYNVGKSICEPALVDISNKILETGKIILPVDVVVSESFADQPGTTVSIADIQDNQMILDFGVETINFYESFLKKSKTILVNGPVGVFEFENFSFGTKQLFDLIGKTNAFKVAGGGDTVSAIEKFKMSANFDYISTAGGAFLEYAEGKKLPTIEALQSKKNEL